jgi:hypothetical protein
MRERSKGSDEPRLKKSNVSIEYKDAPKRLRRGPRLPDRRMRPILPQ